MLVLTIAFITTLYHLSVPVRTPVALRHPRARCSRWLLARRQLAAAGDLQGTRRGGTSIYGPLAAPIAVLLWLYVLSIAVLIGAALNASFDRVFPDDATAGARLELVRRLRAKAMATRMREVGLDDAVPAWEDLSSVQDARAARRPRRRSRAGQLRPGGTRAGPPAAAREKSRAQGRRRP